MAMGRQKYLYFPSKNIFWGLERRLFTCLLNWSIYQKSGQSRLGILWSFVALNGFDLEWRRILLRFYFHSTLMTASSRYRAPVGYDWRHEQAFSCIPRLTDATKSRREKLPNFNAKAEMFCFSIDRTQRWLIWPKEIKVVPENCVNLMTEQKNRTDCDKWHRNEVKVFGFFTRFLTLSATVNALMIG